MTDAATQGWWEPTDDELTAQRAARNAVMEMPLFPDLAVALRGALGYGPHVDMLQHFCYWMHPRHPKMQDRWTMYKTYAEWRDECGLTDRQIKKGRNVLRKRGIAAEKKGPHGRVHYRVDWVALAKWLSLDGISVQAEAPPDDASLDGISVQAGSDANTVQATLDANTVQANTGDYTGDYLQEIPLTEGGDSSSSRTAPGEIDKEQLVSGVGKPRRDADTTQSTDPERRERAAKGDGDDPPPNTAAAPVADARRVAKARSALDALFEEWPGYRDDADTGKWRELGMTAKQLGFAEEIFAPVEVELAAGGLGEEATEREAVAVHG